MLDQPGRSFLLATILLLSTLARASSSAAIEFETQGSAFWKHEHYSLQIYDDGTVIYRGIRNATPQGERRLAVSPQQVAEWMKAFEREGMFSWKPERPPVATPDGGIASVRLRRGAQETTIQYTDWGAGAPAAFFDTLKDVLKAARPRER